MPSFSVGTLTTNGCSYACVISYDTPTRSGDNVTVKNMKATITSTSQYQTLNRIAVSVTVNGVSKASNSTILSANDTSYPSSKEITIIGSGGYTFSRLNKTFSISATFRSTGYGSDWNSDYGSASKSGDVSCPARTYAVTYDANGGSGAPSSQSKEYNVTLTLSLTEPTKTGHDFKGWTGSDGNTYQKGGSYTGNAALTLTAIWQAQTTAMEDVDDTIIGNAPSIAFTPPSASLTYKIKFSLGSWSYTTDTISPGSTARYVYSSYSLPMAVCDEITDKTEDLMQVDLETYSGGTKTGTDTKYFMASVPASVVPVINSTGAALNENNGLYKFLTNYSKVKGTITCTKAYSSPIVEASMTIGEDVKTTVPTASQSDPTKDEAVLVSDLLTSSGSKTVTFKVTDARGRSKTSTVTITVYEYAPPSAAITLAFDGTDTITGTVSASFSSVEGNNSATVAVNGGTPRSVSGSPVYFTSTSENHRSRNYTCTAVVTDLVTSVTVTKKLHPGRGNRFQTLDDGKYYLGMDEQGWKVTDAAFDGGIADDVVWFERSGGEGPAGIGLPMEFDPDADYELIYSTGSLDDAVVAVAFFDEVTASEAGTRYISTTYKNDKKALKPGEIFHTPECSHTLWGILIFGVGETDAIIRKDYANIVVRKIAQAEESLAWELETGNLGLDTPNQKYISRVQMRIDYTGSLKAEIAYDNESVYKTVHESVSDHMRSITVPVKVLRQDHFRIRLSGVGIAKLYSFGMQTDEGSERCLI